MTRVENEDFLNLVFFLSFSRYSALLKHILSSLNNSKLDNNQNLNSKESFVLSCRTTVIHFILKWLVTYLLKKCYEHQINISLYTLLVKLKKALAVEFALACLLKEQL